MIVVNPDFHHLNHQLGSWLLSCKSQESSEGRKGVWPCTEVRAEQVIPNSLHWVKTSFESRSPLNSCKHLKKKSYHCFYDLATNSFPFIRESLLTQLPILIPDITFSVWANLSRRRHPAFIVRGDFISLHSLCFAICRVLEHWPGQTFFLFQPGLD